MKHKSGSLQEHAAVVISSSGEDELSERKRRKKKQRRESASPQEPVAHVSVSPGGLTQSQKKPKKKRRLDDEAEEEEVTLLPTAEPMQHQDKKKKKKKRSGEEPPAVIDVDTPKKKFKEMKEEEICLLSPNGLTHCQKKKKRVKKEEEVMAIATVSPVSPTPEKAPKKKKKKKKKSGETVINKEKKKKRKAADVTSSQEEDVDWVLVAELQGYLPHIKMKCVNQIKKMLVCDLHRFRRFKLQGVPARLGRFSELENQKIRENVADFMVLTGISTAEKLLFPQRFQDEQGIIRKLKKQHGFMEKLAEGIPRPCQQVYLRALKMFDPKHHMGRFSEEELATLAKLHKLHGNNWKLISEKMDRSIYSLQKRFSTIAADHGPWCGEEEKRLKQAVKEYLQTLVGDGSPGLSKDQLSKRLPWQEISQKLETRSWIQCRTKWQSLLEGRLTWYGKVFTRGADGYEAKIRLIKTLYNTCVEDSADINWEEVAQAVGKVTAWSVQRMFSRLKQRKVPHAHTLSFGETIDFLYHHVVPVLKKKLKAYGSWATHQTQQGPDRYQLSDIFYSDMEDDDEEEEEEEEAANS